jgi:ketosteroid isomerase-like protein
MKKINIFFSLSVLLLCSSCMDSKVKNVGIAAVTVTDDISVLKTLIQKWNDCLVKRDLQTLSGFYSDKVSIYGAALSNAQVTHLKEGFLKKHADFNQSIAADITVNKVSESQYKVFFPKHSTISGKTSDVQGFFIFDKIADSWKISTESDNVTDKNLILKKQVKNKKLPATCTDIVLEILMTSPTFLKMTIGLKERIIKNGGSSYGVMLEGSPDSERNRKQANSNTYYFNLHETYPDHSPVIARFSFNELEQKLYEYNVIDDAYVSIEFDKKLLVRFNNYCNNTLAKKLGIMQ